MKIHFSIDDVGGSLRYLIQNRPDSIFDLRLFGKLRDWRSRFGLLVTLYCFVEAGGYSVLQIPKEYTKEFDENSDWLKFGFHGRCGDYPFLQENNYVESFMKMESAKKNLCAGTTSILRLHNWMATPEQVKYLSDKGVTALLYRDDDAMPYDDSGCFYQNGMAFWRTDVCVERLASVSPILLCVGNSRVIAFTHESCFDREIHRIEEALKLYVRNGYLFIT